MSDHVLEQQRHEHKSELGKKSEYNLSYNPNILYPIPRADNRIEIGINPKAPPFFGYDCWNNYEVSWLNQQGKPMAAIAELVYDCNSPFLIESKSLKLYFNSLNSTKFKSIDEFAATVTKDLEHNIKAKVTVNINLLATAKALPASGVFAGECIDHLDVACSVYTVEPKLLITSDEHTKESLYSNLLKSNCPVTQQPDWGSVQISYAGKKINRESLLRYIVSYRNHSEFHEQCIERIFMELMNYCQPEELTVYGRYTRRGGLDINPYRSSSNSGLNDYDNTRLERQ